MNALEILMRHVSAVITDMRSLLREALYERRVQLIRLRGAEHFGEEITALTSLSRTGVFDICKCHAAKGGQGLHDAEGGLKVGELRRFNASQEHEVQCLIANKTPDGLQMVYALWARRQLRWDSLWRARSTPPFLSTSCTGSSRAHPKRSSSSWTTGVSTTASPSRRG